MDLPSGIKPAQMLLKELRAWLIGVLSLKGDQAFAAWGFCVTVLIFANLDILYLGQTPEWVRAIVAAAGLGGFFIWMVRLWQRGIAIWHQHQARRRMLKELDEISNEEKKLLGQLLKAGAKVAPLDWKDSVAGALVARGLLQRDVDNMHPRMHWPHVIPDPVWNEMKRRRDEFITAAEQARRRR